LLLSKEGDNVNEATDGLLVANMVGDEETVNGDDVEVGDTIGDDVTLVSQCFVFSTITSPISSNRHPNTMLYSNYLKINQLTIWACTQQLGVLGEIEESQGLQSGGHGIDICNSIQVIIKQDYILDSAFFSYFTTVNIPIVIIC